MAAECAATATSAAMAAARPPTLLSLPDEALAKLFALLNAQPGVALGWGTRHAHALAAAHPRLDRLFRNEVVTRLEFSWRAWKRDIGPAHFPSSEVQRALQRHPRATALALKGDDTLRSHIDIAACAAPRLTVVELTKMELCKGSGAPALLARCRRLEELRLVDCAPKLDDREFDALVSAAGPRLRVLSLYRSNGMTDAGGVRLRDLTALTDLELSSCEVGGATFQAFAALPALASLRMIRTSFFSAHAAATLPRMRALRELDVSHCANVVPRLWAALPPTLRVLRANCTNLLTQAPVPTCAAALVELHVDLQYNASWAALTGPHVRALRVLSVDETESLGDAGVDAALEAMPQLEELNLYCCSNVGDGTAAAVVRHAALRVVNMIRTEVGPEGVRALRRWEADGCTAAVRGERTTADRFPYMRTVHLGGPRRNPSRAWRE